MAISCWSIKLLFEFKIKILTWEGKHFHTIQLYCSDQSIFSQLNSDTNNSKK